MPVVEVAESGVELYYETSGSDTVPPLLLISPLGGQLLMWEDAFVDLLAQHGFYVVRFDLRDSGLSTRFDDAPPPDPVGILQGDFSSAAYSLSDMASDAAALINALDIASCAVVGLSLGGMIAQMLAIEHPSLVRSLVSISACPSLQFISFGSLINARRETTDREVALEVWMESRLRQASPAYPPNEVALRERLSEMIDRAWYPAGRNRHMAALAVSGDWAARLESLDVPTLVIHGDSDPLINVSGGKATAKAIAGAELMTVDGMGHDLPEALWPQFVNAIAALQNPS